jgi:hypothetical protein
MNSSDESEEEWVTSLVGGGEWGMDGCKSACLSENQLRNAFRDLLWVAPSFG